MSLSPSRIQCKASVSLLVVGYLGSSGASLHSVHTDPIGPLLSLNGLITSNSRLRSSISAFSTLHISLEAISALLSCLTGATLFWQQPSGSVMQGLLDDAASKSKECHLDSWASSSVMSCRSCEVCASARLARCSADDTLWARSSANLC